MISEQEPGQVQRDEAALVERAVRGDASAYGQLYDLHVDRIYRHVLFRLGRVEEAEDITAQVFLNAWQSIRRYRPMGPPFVAWLLRIADNLVVSHYRKNRHLDRALPTERSEPLPDPESLVAERLEHQTLYQALRQLKEEEQRVLLLRFVQDLPSAQVAAILGKSDGAVRVLQHRALAALRKILSHEEHVHEATRAS